MPTLATILSPSFTSTAQAGVVRYASAADLTDNAADGVLTPASACLYIDASGNLAFGPSANVSGSTGTVGIGLNVSAVGTASGVVIGVGAYSNGTSSVVVVGSGANAGANNSVVVGPGATSSGTNSTVVGCYANGVGTLFGYNTQGDGTAIGMSSTGNQSSVAVGSAVYGYNNSVAIGDGASSTNWSCAVGAGATAVSDDCAFGYAASATGGSVAVGNQSVAGNYGVVVGNSASTNGTYNCVFGYGNTNVTSLQNGRIDINAAGTTSRLSIQGPGMTTTTVAVTDTAPTYSSVSSNADGTLCAGMIGFRVNSAQTQLIIHYATSGGVIKSTTLTLA